MNEMSIGWGTRTEHTLTLDHTIAPVHWEESWYIDLNIIGYSLSFFRDVDVVREYYFESEDAMAKYILTEL